MDFEENNRIIEWFLKYQKGICISLASLACVSGALFYNSQKGKQNEFNDFKKAESYYQTFLKGENSGFYSLQELMKKRASLHSKYSPLIDQYALSHHLLTKSNPKKLFSSKFPHYQSFGETTFLIEEGKFSEAETEAVKLKEDMKDVKNVENILYALNLVRIGMLAQKRGGFEQEKRILEEIEPFYTLLSEHFQRQDLAFDSYIESRKKALSL